LDVPFALNMPCMWHPPPGQEASVRLTNLSIMESTEVAKRVANDTDDVLATIPLVRGNQQLTEHLFSQLVDLMLEGILVDLRTQLADGVISAAEYASTLSDLARQCRTVGLLQRASRP